MPRPWDKSPYTEYYDLIQQSKNYELTRIRRGQDNGADHNAAQQTHANALIS